MASLLVSLWSTSCWLFSILPLFSVLGFWLLNPSYVPYTYTFLFSSTSFISSPSQSTCFTSTLLFHTPLTASRHRIHITNYSINQLLISTTNPIHSNPTHVNPSDPIQIEAHRPQGHYSVRPDSMQSGSKVNISDRHFDRLCINPSKKKKDFPHLFFLPCRLLLFFFSSSWDCTTS